MPTVQSASSDCNLIVTGEVAHQVNNMFTFVWEGMSYGQEENIAPSAMNNFCIAQEEKKLDCGSKDDEPFCLIQDWDDVNCCTLQARTELRLAPLCLWHDVGCGPGDTNC